MNSTQLNNLRRKDAYYQHEAPEWMHRVWDRTQSFNWFCKNKRDRLVELGAMRKIGRDWFVDTEAFPPAAEKILGIAQADKLGHANQLIDCEEVRHG